MLSLKHPDGQVTGGLTLWPEHHNYNFTNDISVIWEPLCLWTDTLSYNSPLPEASALSV